MGYFKTKEQLEAINGDIPDNVYFPYFADIAIRARELVNDRSPEEIFEAARFITFFIDHHRSQTPPDTLLPDSAFVDQVSDIRILQLFLAEKGVDSSFIYFTFPQVFGEDDEVGWHVAEFFAIFSIIRLADAAELFSLRERDVLNIFPVERKFKIKKRWRASSSSEIRFEMARNIYRLAGKCALEAMQAINDAERFKKEYDIEMARRDHKSALAGELNNARHKPTHEAKKKVLSDWDMRRTDFASAAKAGNHYAIWLEQQGLKSHEPTTITGWIRDHAKAIGTKLR